MGNESAQGRLDMWTGQGVRLRGVHGRPGQERPQMERMQRRTAPNPCLFLPSRTYPQGASMPQLTTPTSCLGAVLLACSSGAEGWRRGSQGGGAPGGVARPQTAAGPHLVDEGAPAVARAGIIVAAAVAGL